MILLKTIAALSTPLAGYPAAVLGQSRVQSVGDHFREGGHSGDAGALVLVAVVPIVVAVGIAALHQHLQRRRESLNSPQRLFRELCRAHGLGWRQERRLEKIARGLELEDPAELLVFPGHLAGALERAAGRGEASTIRTLHEQLFRGHEGSRVHGGLGRTP